jgi:hypothetical protein
MHISNADMEVSPRADLFILVWSVSVKVPVMPGQLPFRGARQKATCSKRLSAFGCAVKLKSHEHIQNTLLFSFEQRCCILMVQK